MKKLIRNSLIASGAMVAQASACDLCSIYSAAQAHGEVGKGIFAGTAEQFTHYGTVQQDGEETGNAAGQRLDSSIAQVFAGYNFNDRFGVQFNVPVIYRSFRRASGHGGIDRGTEAGFGDVSLLGHANLITKEERDFTFRAALIGGLKFPSGSTDRLEEEEHHHSHGPGAIESVVHGHDLALGSGSVDGIVGGAFSTRWKRAFFDSAVQYAIRTEGDFDFHFGNDLNWSGGPGVLLMLEDAYTVSLQANVAGEYKEEDEHRGSAVHDTGVTTVFLGPKLVFTWSDDLSAELAGGWAVVRENSGYQLMPDYRIHAGFMWHF
jgi:hypothetical protein